MLDRQSGTVIPYPTGLLRWLLRFPLIMYRLGLGWMLGWIPFLVLTTRGRKTGLPRHAMLEWRRHGSKYYLLSGWGKRPNWVQNLIQEPIVTVQRGSLLFPARATVVTDPAEAMRALYMFRRNSPVYEYLLARMSSADTIDLRTLAEVAGEFTVVRLDPMAGRPKLEGVSTANPFLLPVFLSFFVFAALIWRRFRQSRKGRSDVAG